MNADQLKARTRRYALDVIVLCLKLGGDDLARLVRPQLLRAGSGVASNYRAACRGRSTQEFSARLGLVVEESDESELWLDFLQELHCGPPDEVGRLRGEAIELRAIFARARATTLEKLRRKRQAKP
jgi:four helix bundle protein